MNTMEKEKQKKKKKQPSLDYKIDQVKTPRNVSFY